VGLITLEDVWKAYGDRQLLRGISFVLGEGERVGLLGSNGSGKTTLLRILAGVEPPDRGTRSMRRGLRLGYLEQEPALDGTATVRAAVRAGFAGREQVLADLERVHSALEHAQGAELASLLARQARLEADLERHGGHDVEHRVESTLQALGMRDFEARCDTLSGGERRRVALARLLLGEPELLLLDEPTNHLDAFATDWLEDWFLETRTPLCVVTHDRYFLDRVVDRIVELDRGTLVPYEGGYAEYLEARAARLDTERKAEGARMLLLRRETVWMRRGAPARTTKAKARIHRFHELEDSAAPALPDELELELPPGPRLGSRGVRLSGVSKRFAERVVLDRVDLELRAGQRLGIVGPNGAGKSTLVRILTGELEPDAGVREVGETVRFMGIDQQRTGLDLERTPAQELAGSSDVVRVGERSVRVESLLDRFGLDLKAQREPLARLSGGERSRLMLARLSCAGGNVLVLDEPTNDLDLATLRALEEALIAFPGAVAIVSHDRWFLDRVATQVLVLDGSGRARMHPGDVSGLLAEMARERAESKAPAQRTQAGPSASAPQRARRRIAPWEQRELDDLEAQITAREAQLADLDARLSEPGLYSGPRPALEEVQTARKRLEQEIAALYARWEALEALRG
jgi:ABC transport system ATP-binding/permease protein